MVSKLGIKKKLQHVLRNFGYEEFIPDRISRDHFFDLYFSLKRPFIVQVGVNDGMSYDPLHKYISKYNLPGILVEPQVDAFERLTNNYKSNPNLKFANVAIGEEDGELPFFRIKKELILPGKEYKATSGSSFYREQIVQNVINRLPPNRHNILKEVSTNPNDYIEEIKVPTLTLRSFLKKFEVETIDLFFTDCQGHDYKVLKQLDFTQFLPDIINIEQALLSEDELFSTKKLLNDHDYNFFVSEADICAYRTAK